MPRLQYLYLAKLRLREGALIFENAQVLHEAGKVWHQVSLES